MMRILLAILLAAAPVSAAMAQDSGGVEQPAVNRNQINDMLREGKAAEAIEILDPILEGFERRFGSGTQARRCEEGPRGFGKTTAQTNPDERTTDIVVVDGDWCFALWAKGYALVDVRDIRGGLPFLERAATMAPDNSVYLSELGNAYQELKRWDAALDVFTRAAAAAERLSGRERVLRLGRALRGMRFCLIELGRWDEAETHFNRALELDPNDQRAKNELQYIRQNRP